MPCHSCFTPGKQTQYPLYWQLGGPHGWSERLQKILPWPEFRPRTTQLVASRYTDYSMLARYFSHSRFNFLVKLSDCSLVKNNSVFTAVFSLSVNEYKICTFKKKKSHWRWLFFCWGWFLCVCMCGWFCVRVCARMQLHSCKSITLQSFGSLCACQTLSPPYLLISHIVSFLLNWWGWGKLVIQMLTFRCAVFCKRIWVMCLLVWLQVLYWSFSPSLIAKCTTPNHLFYAQVMLLKKWA